jgi:hypothetical protein
MPTFLQLMVFLAFALALVAPLPILGFDPLRDDNVRLSNGNN